MGTRGPVPMSNETIIVHVQLSDFKAFLGCRKKLKEIFWVLPN